ncbi:hypothetical protein SDC9_114142 [bioreactor metagenome]|uniref:Uncharacterized protein n=1 Tax=bioreactor metagenome TaxID=1076179 RepID=A0A645BPL7_9ZZZZ
MIFAHDRDVPADPFDHLARQPGVLRLLPFLFEVFVVILPDEIFRLVHGITDHIRVAREFFDRVGQQRLAPGETGSGRRFPEALETEGGGIGVVHEDAYVNADQQCHIGEAGIVFDLLQRRQHCFLTGFFIKFVPRQRNQAEVGEITARGQKIRVHRPEFAGFADTAGVVGAQREKRLALEPDGRQRFRFRPERRGGSYEQRRQNCDGQQQHGRERMAV